MGAAREIVLWTMIRFIHHGSPPIPGGREPHTPPWPAPPAPGPLIAAYPALQRSTSVLSQDAAWLRVTERPVSADVSQVIAAEIVVDCDVDNQVAVTAEVDVFEHQVGRMSTYDTF